MWRAAQIARRDKRRVERGIGLITEYYRQQPADLVVSVTPFVNGSIARGVHGVDPAIPFVVIPTDYTDCMPGYWIDDADAHYLMGSDRLVRQARDHGHPESRVHRISGRMLHPAFIDRVDTPKPQRRASLGLHDTPTVLLTYGAHPPPRSVASVLKALESTLAAQTQVASTVGPHALSIAPPMPPQRPLAMRANLPDRGTLSACVAPLRPCLDIPRVAQAGQQA